jgi:excisionase family DNA binding protein
LTQVTVTTPSWLSLQEACRLLDVSESALRLWADRGSIRAYRTPGGHRRFSRDDVLALLRQETRRANHGTSWDQAALQRIRRRLRGSKTAPPAWFEEMDEQERLRLRMFGHRLLTLASEYASQPRHRGQLLDEAGRIGEEYGEELGRRGTTLSQVIEAFMFFRNAMMEVQPEANGAPQSQSNAVADAVLMGIAKSYEHTLVGGGS